MKPLFKLRHLIERAVLVNGSLRNAIAGALRDAFVPSTRPEPLCQHIGDEST